MQTLLLDLSFVPIDFFNLISDDLLLLCPDMLHLRNVRYFEWLIIFHYWRKRFFLRSLLFNGKLFWPEWLLLIALLINNLDGAKLFGLFDGPHLVVRLPAERLWAVNHLEFPRGLVFIVTGRWISGKGCSLVFSCELWLVLVLAAIYWELRVWTLTFNRLLVLFSQFFVDQRALTVWGSDGPLGIFIINLDFRWVFDNSLIKAWKLEIILFNLMIALLLLEIIDNLLSDQVHWLCMLSSISPTTFHICFIIFEFS